MTATVIGTKILSGSGTVPGVVFAVPRSCGRVVSCGGLCRTVSCGVGRTVSCVEVVVDPCCCEVCVGITAEMPNTGNIHIAKYTHRSLAYRQG